LIYAKPILLFQLFFLRCSYSFKALQLYWPFLFWEERNDPFEDEPCLCLLQFFSLVLQIRGQLAKVVVRCKHPSHHLDVKAHHLDTARWDALHFLFLVKKDKAYIGIHHLLVNLEQGNELDLILNVLYELELYPHREDVPRLMLRKY
jgi:hypothetical protein